MADQTPNLSLPYIKAGQSQKEVTHAQSLVQLDAIVQLSVLSRTASAPPASPSEGQRWIVGPSPTGAWAGHAGQVAGWYQGWRYWTPAPGWIAWVAEESDLAHWSGSAWVTGTSGGVSQLAELSDVALGTPAAHEFLGFDTATGKWADRRPALADMSDVNLSTAPTEGQYAAWVGGKLQPVDAPSGGTGGDTAPASGGGGPAVLLCLQGYSVDLNGASVGGPPIIRSQQGVSSVDYLGNGALQVNFSAPFANADYVVELTATFSVDALDGTVGVVGEPRRPLFNGQGYTRTTTHMQMTGGYNASTSPYLLFLYNLVIYAAPGS